jgi:hypothetical protein
MSCGTAHCACNAYIIELVTQAWSNEIFGWKQTGREKTSMDEK